MAFDALPVAVMVVSIAALYGRLVADEREWAHWCRQTRARWQLARPKHRARLSPANVGSLMQWSRTEMYISKEHLSAMSIYELKALMRERGVDMRGDLDEQEAVERLLASAGARCNICYEDYTDGDMRHMLRCGHSYHRACIERWCAGSS